MHAMSYLHRRRKIKSYPEELLEPLRLRECRHPLPLRSLMTQRLQQTGRVALEKCVSKTLYALFNHFAHHPININTVSSTTSPMFTFITSLYTLC